MTCSVGARRLHTFRKIHSKYSWHCLCFLVNYCSLLPILNLKVQSKLCVWAPSLPNSFAACLVFILNPHSPLPPHSIIPLKHSNIPFAIQFWDLHLLFLHLHLFLFLPLLLWIASSAKQSKMKRKTNFKVILSALLCFHRASQVKNVTALLTVKELFISA